MLIDEQFVPFNFPRINNDLNKRETQDQILLVILQHDASLFALTGLFVGLFFSLHRPGEYWILIFLNELER